MKPSQLTPRQGKVLRYVVCRTRDGKEHVNERDIIVKIKWSDLPHSIMQAKATLNWLREHGLIERSKKGFLATAAGDKLISKANFKKMWNDPPPRSITNQPREGK